MKTLDRYIIRSFLYSAALWLVVMLSLRIVSDLFVNMDEFAEKQQGFGKVMWWVITYYASHSMVYLAQLGGVIVVASAAFTVARMNYSNELTAMMASGVSLHRVLRPIILCALIMSVLIFIHREVVIPPLAHALVRDRDYTVKDERFPVRFLTDSSNAVWYSPDFRLCDQKMRRPIIIVRDKDYLALARISGNEAQPAKINGQDGWLISRSDAFEAVLSRLDMTSRHWLEPPNVRRIWTGLSPGEIEQAAGDRHDQNAPFVLRDERYGLEINARSVEFRRIKPNRPADWILIEPTFTFFADNGQILGCFLADLATWSRDSQSGGSFWMLHGGKLFYPSDLSVAGIELRQSSRWLEYMSIGQLDRLLELKKVSDPTSAIMAKHIRITEPLNNMVMLLIGVPFILSRERNVKTSALRCLIMVAVFYAFIYFSRHLGLSPVWATWLPALIFGPIAAVMVDSVKT